MVELDSTLTFDLFGFELGFGDLPTDVTEAILEVELDSELVVTAIGVLLLGASLATAEGVADAANAIGLESMTATETADARTAFETSDDDQPDIGEIRVELSRLSSVFTFGGQSRLRSLVAMVFYRQLVSTPTKTTDFKRSNSSLEEQPSNKRL